MAEPTTSTSSVAPQVHLDRWSAGRVVLLGDAGYCPSPLTGMGTSLALVGAYVLAGELARPDGTTSGPSPRTRTDAPLRPAGRSSRPAGSRARAPHRLAMGMRVLTMRLMISRPLEGLARVFFSKADAIDLPDYADSAVRR